MLEIKQQTLVCTLKRDEHLLAQLRQFDGPVILKGLVADWPAVICGQGLEEYLKDLAADVPVQAMRAEPQAKGRYFYNDDFSGFNFVREQTHLSGLLDGLAEHGPGLYMGSTTLAYCLPDFARHNPMPLEEVTPLVSAWIGNQTRVAAHFDVPQNIACVVGGRRRFILFPPQQVENLYVGPLDFTPAGQPVSMVDFAEPDVDRFPRFTEALKHAQVADLAPGDALYIPSMWWHQVEAFDSLNMLVNYWWRETPQRLGQPMDALQHAILAIRDLPTEQKQAFKTLFDHYVFNADSSSHGHIPQSAKGILGEIDDTVARRTRAELLRKLNR